MTALARTLLSDATPRPRRRAGRRRETAVVAMVVAAALTVALLGGAPGPAAPRAAGAQEPPSSSAVEPTQEEPQGGIIPEPDAGRAPEDAGDRGGALQLLVLGLVLAAVAAGVALVVRESRRTRARSSLP